MEKAEKEKEKKKIKEKKENKIKALSKDTHIYEKIKNKKEKTIYGREKIKEDIALQIFGGFATSIYGTHLLENIQYTNRRPVNVNTHCSDI